jgi:predicted alpha/beta-hydrolase family hydrolase
VTVDSPAGSPRAVLVLGHGAGGDIDAPDLVAVAEAAVSAGVAVVRATQPYRVAGRRAPAPATHLDEAWTDLVQSLDVTVPLLVGGRSSGARVACRTAGALGAVAVVALAFPTHPPGRPDRSREDELPTDLPTLVVNGDRDPFGIPTTGAPNVELRVIAGADHGLKKSAALVAATVVDWLRVHGWAL